MADPKTDAPVMQEIATSRDGRDITKPFMSLLEVNQDTVLRGRGGGLEVYEEVLRDDQVFSTFQQRRLAVISKEWDVVAGAKDPLSQAAADHLRDMLDAIAFDETCNKMLFGIFHGYAVSELLYARDGARVIIKDIKVKKARRFRFDTSGNLRLLTSQSRVEGEVMPPKKFWTFRVGADTDDEAYGRGLGYWLYWPVWFKRNTVKFWALYLEKFGGPTAIGTFPAGTTADDQAKLLQALRALQTDSAVIMPEGMTASLIEALRSGTADYVPFVDRMDAAISKVVLSQTMTTDNGSSKAQGSVHMEVRDEVVKADADLLCASFNKGPATWLTEWNFPGAVPPRVWRRIEPPEDLARLAQRDAKIYAMGFSPTDEYIADTYGEGWIRRDPVSAPADILPGLPGGPPLPAKKIVPGPGKVADFAERPRDEIDDLVSQADTISGPAMDQMIDNLRTLLDTSASLPEVAERLLTIYPGLSAQALAEVMRDALVVADLTGRATAVEV